jgi:uncharacterized paraquat-inducible protein A
MRRLLALAALIALLFGALHLLGLRQDVAVLSGSRVSNAFGGVAYGLCYFAVVVGAPIAVLAAMGLAVERRIRRGRSRPVWCTVVPRRPGGA